jgi:DNA-binding transcriptional LysR family regulator
MPKSTSSRIKLRQLALVAAIGKSRNLRRAAADLHMTQPSATRLLQDLEGTFSCLLFERSRSGMTPTIYGEALIRHARWVLAGLESAREEVEALAKGASGRVAIGTLGSTAPVLLPRSIALLKATRPGIVVSVIEGSHALLVDALARGELDVTLGRVTGEPGHGDLAFEALYEEEFRVVCGTQHPLARAKRLKLADLAEQAWILPPEGLPIRQSLDTLFTRSRAAIPRNVIESVSLLTNQTLLQEATVLGVLPAVVAKHYERLGLLRVLPVPVPGLKPLVAVITRKNVPLSPAAAALVDALRSVARDLQ